jgi:hypothetical protein
MIHMPFLAGDLIDSYVEKVAKIPVRQTIVDNAFNGFTYCIPMETKKLTNHIPSHKLGPSSQYHTQRQRERAFPLGPWNGLYFDSTISALDSSGRINQRNGDTPERNMLPASFLQCVVPRPLAATRGTNNPASFIGKQVNHYFTLFFSNLFDAMPLESQRFSDYTFNEHESYPPFL